MEILHALQKLWEHIKTLAYVLQPALFSIIILILGFFILAKRGLAKRGQSSKTPPGGKREKAKRGPKRGQSSKIHLRCKQSLSLCNTLRLPR